MMIWKEEIKKLVKQPMLWGLIVLFLGFNIFLMWSYIGEYKEELKETHDDIVNGNIGEADIADCLALYNNLDMVEVKNIKEELMGYHPKGSYKDYIDSCYEKLNQRVEETKANGEERQQFYPGQYYRLHNILYAKIFRFTLLEMTILISFAVLYLMDYERIQKTGDIVYSSMTGRKIQKIKLLSGITVGMILSMILLFATLTVYFSQVSYKGLWNISMASAMMAEPRGMLMYPFITFHSITVWQYLFASVGIGGLLVAMIGFMVGGLWLLIRNSYFTFVVEALLLVGFLVLGTKSTATWLDIILSINPTIFWYHSGAWFMENELFLCFPGNELVSLGVQFVIVTITGMVGYINFLKKDCLS